LGDNHYAVVKIVLFSMAIPGKILMRRVKKISAQKLFRSAIKSARSSVWRQTQFKKIYIVKKSLVKAYKSLTGGKQQILSIIKKEDILNIHCFFEEFGHHSSETLVDSPGF
jgi:CRP-like cAMP-binding protein